MTMQKNFAAYGAAILLLGGLLGYAIGSRPEPQQSQTGSHMMPNGTMMHGSMDMAQMMADMNATLVDKTGDAFDKAFIDEMIVHHQGAVDMAKLVLERSERPELRTLAEEIIAAQTREIGMMRDWRAQWFGRN